MVYFEVSLLFRLGYSFICQGRPGDSRAAASPGPGGEDPRKIVRPPSWRNQAISFKNCN